MSWAVYKWLYDTQWNVLQKIMPKIDQFCDIVYRKPTFLQENLIFLQENLIFLQEIPIIIYFFDIFAYYFSNNKSDKLEKGSTVPIFCCVMVHKSGQQARLKLSLSLFI